MEALMSDPANTPEFYSTVPISTPTVVPEAEDVAMNGFAWSRDFGLLVGIGDQGKPIVDELYRLRNPLDIATEGDTQQGLRGL